MSRPIRTYGRRPALPSSPPGMVFAPSSSDTILDTPPSSPKRCESPIHERKRKLALSVRDTNRPEKQGTLKGFFKRAKVEARSPRAPVPVAPTPKLHQLQFSANSLRTCPECSMSYLRGSDEAEHTRHHARVTRGIPWIGRKEARVVRDHIPLQKAMVGVKEDKDKSEREVKAAARPLSLFSAPARSTAGYYRIVTLDANISSRVVSEVLDTVDRVLSAPALPASILARCKLVLAITSAEPPSAKKGKKDGTERVVAAVVSQPIKWAMRVVDGGSVDAGGGVSCDPTRLPTPLGIHRLFTVPAYRGLGLARALLDTAARETVYGCEFDPAAGQVAFSQPTESGRQVMLAWGGDAVRVFVDDESQL